MLEVDGVTGAGQGVSTDIIDAAARAYVRALSVAVARARRVGCRRPIGLPGVVRRAHWRSLRATDVHSTLSVITYGRMANVQHRRRSTNAADGRDRGRAGATRSTRPSSARA